MPRTLDALARDVLMEVLFALAVEVDTLSNPTVPRFLVETAAAL